jgi:gentisate 1,2-dioxygenase
MRTLRAIAFASIITACASLLAASASIAQEAAAEPTYEVVLRSEVAWTHLNPKRGDLAPKAGTLWGDRNGTEPTGYLLKPPVDFQSPPHIHNVSYRAVVISGVLHNDDPGAANMWMPAGSFWTQPKGEVHITASKGKEALAYIEIEEGPYLVHPKEQAFDSGERPVNVDNSNIVWLDAADITWVDQHGIAEPADGPKLAYLWGDTQSGQLNGTLIKLPAGFTGEIYSHGSTFRAVVIKGLPQYKMKAEVKALEPGSYFSSQGGSAVHHISSTAGEESIIYVRTDGKYDVIQTQRNN